MAIPHRLSSCRGGALLSAILFTMVLLVLAGSALRLVVNERKLNARHALRLQARNIAEAHAEYGFAQIRFKLDNRTSFPAGLLNPSGADAIVLPPVALFPNLGLETADRELIAGTINPVTDPSSGFYFVDANDPANAFDSVKNRRVFRKDVVLLSRVTVNSSTGSPITARVSQRLSVRDIPLFSNAIFYNMDMELYPGPPMIIAGPVHVNGNMYVTSTRDDGNVRFDGPVSTTGDLLTGMFMAHRSKNGTTTLVGGPTGNTDAYSLASARRPITFLTPSNFQVDLRDPIADIWRDHRMGTLLAPTDITLNSFRSFASNSYGGNLQTSTHGVQKQNPVAIGDYAPDPDPLNGIEESINDARTLIEPPLLATDPSYRPEQEAQKMSRKSGIYITVNPSAVDRTARMPDGTRFTLPARQYRAFRKDGTPITLPGSTIATAGFDSATPGGRAIITVKPAQMTDVRRVMPGFSERLSRSATNRFVPRVLDIVELDVTALKLAVERTVNGASSATIYNYVSPAKQSTYQSTATSPVDIDDRNRIGGFASTNWNGAVYIESIDAETRKDSGVRLINGRGRLPSGGADPGLTIATNDALYVLGHYNSTGTDFSAAAASTPEAGETPAALLADSVTILSQPTFYSWAPTTIQQHGWNDHFSATRHMESGSNGSWATLPWSNANQIDGLATGRVHSDDPLDIAALPTYPAWIDPAKYPATSTVIAAAIVSGIVPSNKNGNGQASGGVQNLPRYLENWNNTQTSVIRGSMIAIFESRVTTEQNSVRNFQPPIRLWGLNSLFAQGLYPPQTPLVRSYTRVDFKEVSAAEYATIKAGFGW